MTDFSSVLVGIVKARRERPGQKNCPISTGILQSRMKKVQNLCKWKNCFLVELLEFSRTTP